MARSDLFKKPEWKYQEELRDQRRRRRRKTPPQQQPSDRKQPSVTYPLRLVRRADILRAEAYRVLEEAAVLREAYRRFRYHDPRQRACMYDEFVLEPESLTPNLARQIVSEVSAGWRQGKLIIETEGES